MFYQKTTHILQSAFDRAVGPLLIAGSLGLAGCSTVNTSRLNWETCDLTDISTTMVGIPDINMGASQSNGGNGASVTATIPGLNLKFGSSSIQQDNYCYAAKTVMRSTFIPEAQETPNGYKIAGQSYEQAPLALFVAFYNDPENDPRLKAIVSASIQRQFGLGADDLLKSLREEAEKRRQAPAPVPVPPVDPCVADARGRLRCDPASSAAASTQTPAPH